MKYEIETTENFTKWLKGLKDFKARKAIANRLTRVRLGNFGDHKSVGGGVSELKIKTGKGYRVYYTVRNGKLVILLSGGHKGTQSKDIEKAKMMAADLE